MTLENAFAPHDDTKAAPALDAQVVPGVIVVDVVSVVALNSGLTANRMYGTIGSR